jgi:enoyl-CoA hydratase/carnithine racemase
MTELLIEQDGPVLILRLNRPDKHNALNQSLTSALLDALGDADRRADTRAVVLCGAGPSFCAGADTTEFAALRSVDAARARADLTMRLHGTFAEMGKPVIGAVHGRALGGGAGLALACDLLVLAETASIGYPELKHGIVAAIVMANLVRQVGRKPAFELVSLGEPIDARRAAQWGLANRVVVESDLMSEALRMGHILARHSADAMTATKRLFHLAADLPLVDALHAGRDTNARMRAFPGTGEP